MSMLNFQAMQANQGWRVLRKLISPALRIVLLLLVPVILPEAKSWEMQHWNVVEMVYAIQPPARAHATMGMLVELAAGVTVQRIGLRMVSVLSRSVQHSLHFPLKKYPAKMMPLWAQRYGVQLPSRGKVLPSAMIAITKNIHVVAANSPHQKLRR